MDGDFRMINQEYSFFLSIKTFSRIFYKTFKFIKLLFGKVFEIL